MSFSDNALGLQMSLTASDATVIEFNTGEVLVDGTQWWVTQLDGWEAPGPRQNFVNKAGDHGAILTESYFDKRALTIGGIVKVASVPGDPSTTQDRFWGAWNRLIALLAVDLVGDGTDTTLSVNEFPTGKYVFCKLTGRPKHTFHPGYFEFSLPLICRDPHKYLIGGLGPLGGEVGTW